jgi:DNA (cytosine-5)-methyltransferase 1
LLLPTPQARDHHGAQLPEQRRAAGHEVNLNDVARGLAERWARDGWGPYEPAVRRWETVTGRPAPFPGQAARGRSFRLSPQFAEWAMGLPGGWVTSVPGLPYAAQIRALGNGVVPAQAVAALRLLARVTAGAVGTLPCEPGAGPEEDYAA